MKHQLEELRRQHAIRQEDLAQALGVSRQTVISLEKGKYNPSLALAFKLARYFNLSIEDIFDDSDDCPDAASPR
ncbi:MAG: helix-turn-helix transcriptional regulator [Christensenellales bacterium]